VKRSSFAAHPLQSCKKRNPWHVIFCRLVSLMGAYVRAMHKRFVTDVIMFVGANFDRCVGRPLQCSLVSGPLLTRRCPCRLLRTLQPQALVSLAELEEAEAVTSLFSSLAAVGVGSYKIDSRAREWSDGMHSDRDVIRYCGSAAGSRIYFL
jgi:hypothetical protein